MTDVNHVIEAIDHALEDYGTSDDAMRWTPEPRPKASYSVVYTQRDGTETSWSIDDNDEGFRSPSHLCPEDMRVAIQEIVTASGFRRYYEWEEGRPADHTEHIHWSPLEDDDAP